MDPAGFPIIRTPIRYPKQRKPPNDEGENPGLAIIESQTMGTSELRRAEGFRVHFCF